MNRDLHSTRLRLGVLALASTLALAACGGGGGSPGTTGAGATTPGTGTGTTPGTGTGTTTPVTTAKLTMVIVDGAGTAVTSLSGGQTATIKATVLGADGKPAVGAIVQFTSATAGLVDFTPGTGSALTDSNGIATVTIKPSSVTAAGAVSLTATSVVGGTTATASAGISVGAAPLTVGALSFATTPPAVLAAFSTLTLNVPVTSGGQPVSTAPGVVLNSLCSGDGTATLVPGTIDKGILAVTYTNKGCLRGTDTITASIGSSTQTINVAVGAANIGTVLFTGSNPAGTSIVLKGSGGLGRSESAQLTFKIVDQQGNGLAGVDVTFAPTTSTGNLTVSPLRATTDTSGNVTTMVSSGTIPTPVTVQASATRNGTTITGSSATLTISTGLPIQKSMSMSADKFNIEGLDYDGEIANLTILMADQYGNRISDGTAVNFVTEGGSVGTSAQGACTTTDGGCSVTLKSQAVKPTNGRVTVLAFAQGIEDFIDLNGDGQYTCTNFTDADGKATPTFRPMVDICVSGGEPFTDMGDAFLDTNTDGVYTAMENDLPFPYGHTTYSAAGNGRWGINYIRRSMELVFSGSQAFLTRQYCTAGVCRDWVTATDGDPTVVAGLSGPGCLSQMITFRVADRNNNPMPYGTAVAGADGSNVSPQSTAPATIGSTTHIGGTIHTLNIKPDTDCKAGNFSVAVTTPKGNGTQFLFKSGN